MELLKLLSGSEIVAQIICFFLILFILRIVMWKRFLKLLDDRKDRISSELRKIENSKKEVSDIKADYDRRIGRIELEAKAKIEEAISEGKNLVQAMKDKAEAESEKIFENAKENIRIEVAKATEDLKNTIVDLSVEVAGKVIEERLTTDDDKKLAEEFLKRMTAK